MRRFFDYESPFISAILSVMDMIVLNLVFLVSCIPVITIGASVSALYCVQFHAGEGGAVRSYIAYWKRDVFQATKVWLVFIVISVMVFLDYCLSRSNTAQKFTVFSGVLLGAGFMILMTFGYALPLVGLVKQKTKETYTDSLRYMIAYLPRSAVMAVIRLVPFILLWFYPYHFLKFGYLFLLIWFSFTSRINAWILKKPFHHLLPERTDLPEEIVQSIDPEQNAREARELDLTFYSHFASQKDEDN